MVVTTTGKSLDNCALFPAYMIVGRQLFAFFDPQAKSTLQVWLRLGLLLAATECRESLNFLFQPCTGGRILRKTQTQSAHIIYF